jgi:hypothetical protein
MTQPYDPNVLTTVDCSDMIRLGSRYASRYILPSRLLKRSKSLVSAGISFNWSFETRLTRASKLSDMVLIDATTTILAYVQRVRKHIGNSTTPRHVTGLDFLYQVI